jgi:hypothetical protein
VVIIVVVVLIIVGIVAAMAMNNVSENPNKGDVGIVVHGGYVSHDGYFLADGHKYVVYNVTVTNGKSSEMTFSVLSFELHTSNGTIYMPSYSAGTPMNTPEALSAGGSYSLTLGYEIPETDSGVQIVYDWLFDHGSASVPL